MKITRILMDTKNKTKTIKVRKESDGAEDLLEKSKPKEDFVPLHLVVKGLDRQKPLSSIGLSSLSNAVKEVANFIKTTKFLSNGLLYVHCLEREQAKRLLALKSLCSTPVTVEALVYKGVVSGRDLTMCSAEEIRAEWSEYDVLDVQWITKQENDGQRSRTHSLLVSFARPTLPEEVRAGYLTLPVARYVAPPVRCYRCQRFGHLQSKCRKGETCSDCGRPAHGKSRCKKQLCINCKGRHSAFSPVCPAWRNRQTIERVRVAAKVSRKEARRRVAQQNESEVSGIALHRANSENNSNKERELLRSQEELQESVHHLSNVIRQQQEHLVQLTAKLNEAMQLMNI